MTAKAAAVVALALCLAIGGDGGVNQRPVYPGECLARGRDGKLFIARAGELCVALQPPPRPEAGGAVPRHIAEAIAEPPQRSKLPRREPVDLCGMP